MYEVLYADPPWDYKGQLQHNGKTDTGGALAHYGTVTLNDLKYFLNDIPVADDAVLFMWTSSPHLPQAIELGYAWGFNYLEVAFVWNKMRVNPGFYTMSQCELCLLFERGKGIDRNQQRVMYQYVEELRGKHSAKPDVIRNTIDYIFHHKKKLELFARKRVEGWDAIGNEL